MKNIFLLLLLFPIFNGFCQTGKITRVIDGDTYVAKIKGVNYTCRLENIDAPEKDQFMGLAIKDSVTSLLLNKTCRFEIHGHDKYKRALVFITVNNEKLDSILIARGWASYYPLSKQPYVLLLPAVEIIARFNQRGIWSCPFNIPPWIWRHLKKQQKIAHKKKCA